MTATATRQPVLTLISSRIDARFVRPGDSLRFRRGMLDFLTGEAVDVDEVEVVRPSFIVPPVGIASAQVSLGVRDTEGRELALRVTLGELVDLVPEVDFI